MTQAAHKDTHKIHMNEEPHKIYNDWKVWCLLVAAMYVVVGFIF